MLAKNNFQRELSTLVIHILSKNGKTLRNQSMYVVESRTGSNSMRFTESKALVNPFGTKAGNDINKSLKGKYNAVLYFPMVVEK